MGKSFCNYWCNGEEFGPWMGHNFSSCFNGTFALIKLIR